MSRAIAAGGCIAGAALAVALGGAAVRVGALERGELEAASAWRAVGTGTRVALLEATLLRGDEVTFELCSRDAMEPAAWAGTRVGVFRVSPREEMFSLAVDARMLARVARGAGTSCVTFGHVRALAIDAASVDVAIELAEVTPAVAGVPLRARILARRPLGTLDRALVAASLVAAIALVVLLGLRAPGIERETSVGSPLAGAGRAVLGLGVVLGAGIALGALAPGGPTWGLAGGLALALCELGIAVALADRAGARLGALGLERPGQRSRAVAGFLLAPFAGLVLFVLARIALSLVPSTGEAPIEAFVRWPSGMLSFAVLAVVAPVAEEIFFRGFVYRALRGHERAPDGVRAALAIVGSWLLFAFAHLPQDWGNWGGMLSVLTAGLGFTLLRAVTGSTLVPCLAHLVYNGLLAASVLAVGAV